MGEWRVHFVDCEMFVLVYQVSYPQLLHLTNRTIIILCIT